MAEMISEIASACFPAIDRLALLWEEYGLAVLDVTRLDRGHTNASFRVTQPDGGRFILRQSWRGKPEAQIRREEAVLAFLEQAELPAPRLVPTVDGRVHAVVEAEGPEIFCHLFDELPGRIRYKWYDAAALSRSDRHQRSLMAALARLHAALSGFPFPSRAQPLARLHERLQRLRRPRWLPGSGRMALEFDTFRAGAEAILAAAESLPWKAASFQYCHGDFQLENILFAGDEVTGVVDFDSLMFSARELDLAFALFSICRHRDDRAFRWDAELLRSCLGHYLDAARDCGCPPAAEFLDGAHLVLLRKLFCLDQALQHLDRAAKGIWELAEGIGFLPCYREVLPGLAGE